MWRPAPSPCYTCKLPLSREAGVPSRHDGGYEITECRPCHDKRAAMRARWDSWDCERDWAEYRERIKAPCSWCFLPGGGTKAYSFDGKACCHCCWDELIRERPAPRVGCSCMFHQGRPSRLTAPVSEAELPGLCAGAELRLR